ncbi:MAG: hypothetical protein ACRELB_23315, partial [Polyangiaceae bacterium]
VAALPRVLGREVAAEPFADALIHVYLQRMYSEEAGLNFHTFVGEDFLEHAENDALLRAEKPYESVKPLLQPDPARVALLDYSYRSVLVGLDEPPVPAPFQPGDLELPFEIDGSGEEPAAVYHRAEDLPGAVVVLARESHSCAGLEHGNGWRAHEVRELPFMIHPTELQLTGVEADGSLHLFLYDHAALARPGETLRFDVRYHWMQMGKRLRRELRLAIRAVANVARDRLTRTGSALPWTARHLERWLGNDLTD